MRRREIERWLCQDDSVRLDELWTHADAVRRDGVGDAVHLRALIEISNVCARRCMYCGLRSPNRQLKRYRMTAGEVIACALQACERGYGTVVLQGGEDPALERQWLAAIIRRIKSETGLAVTLSLGEWPESVLALWRDAGADRYLLRFETSDPALYGRLHPPAPGRRVDRITVLAMLRALGYETGSGVMVGLPGQSYSTLARDIELFSDGNLDLDMIGVGPYISHAATPLARRTEAYRAVGGEQVPATALMTAKVVALARIVCPDANIPATTALSALDERGLELGLTGGANVVMPNVTPPEYRALYDIYPGKGRVHEASDAFDEALKARIAAFGRHVGTGRGDSPNYTARMSLADGAKEVPVTC